MWPTESEFVPSAPLQIKFTGPAVGSLERKPSIWDFPYSIGSKKHLGSVTLENTVCCPQRWKFPPVLMEVSSSVEPLKLL